MLDCGRMKPSIHAAALAVLMTADPEKKRAAAIELQRDWADGRYGVHAGDDDATPIVAPGRPPRPLLVAPSLLASRRPGCREGHAALLHAIAHIEFNAIDLALDCVHRFRSQAAAFHHDWLQVAAEEALHFGMVRARLQALGFDYGDFPAHNGLWDMACRTAGDLLARMALVPRVLEARGLDATPGIIARLRAIGDAGSIAVLERILADEIGHVAIGDRWFRAQCRERGVDAERTYLQLIERFGAPRPQAPMNRAARLAAGFGAAELDALGALGARKNKAAPGAA